MTTIEMTLNSLQEERMSYAARINHLVCNNGNPELVSQYLCCIENSNRAAIALATAGSENLTPSPGVRLVEGSDQRTPAAAL